ncbi:MAG: GAF domain-containing protein [Verrucomicrobiota bacterium]|nr:GAF domain-containing protein [Verrucomicrobiota bacterium]
MKILLVEPDRATSMSLAATLRAHDCDVVSATDAIQTLTVALREKPDALIVSSQLPAGGGLNVLKRLRSVVHTAVTPVIMLSERGGHDTSALLAAGAQECFERPIDPLVVCDAIRRHCGRQAVPPLSPPPETIQAPARLAALQKPGVMDSSSTEWFDELTQLAAKLLQAPTATVTLIDRHRQFFKGQVGLPPLLAAKRETPLSHSFCQWVVSGQQEVVVADARQHAVLQSNLAVRDYNVIAYAGVPLTVNDNQPIGAFCAIDSEPHAWSEGDLEILRALGRIAEVLISVPPQSSGRNDATLRQSEPPADLPGDLAEAINAGLFVLRRAHSRLAPSDHELLLDILETLGNTLLQTTGRG